jgi:predicted DNA-binding protein (MmcQ/YjbR family)
MTKEEYLSYCFDTFGTEADYPFDDWMESAVLRHKGSRKWYGIVMRVSRRKFGFDSDEMVDIVNLKRPIELYDAFGVADGVYPAYHMNKLHWISLLLTDATPETIAALTALSYDATIHIPKRKRKYQEEDPL